MAKATVEESKENSTYWASRPYLDKQTQTNLLQAEAFLVPQEGFRGQDVLAFPVGTEEFYTFLKSNFGDKHSIELAIEDADYKELALHSAVIVIGTLVVKYLVAPIVTKVVADYIGKRLKGAPTKEAATVRFVMIVEEQTPEGLRAVKISYDGPAQEFLPAMEEAIKPPSMILASATPVAALPQLAAPAEKESGAKP